MKMFVLIAAFLSAGIASAACKEGAKGYVTKYNHDGEAYSVARTCVNGTYMTPEEKAAYIYNPRSRCLEGSRGSVTLYNHDGEAYSEARTCVNGTYMTAEEQAAYVYVPRNRCKEGTYRRTPATDYFSEYMGRDHVPDITVVCRSGKWIPVN